MEFLNGNDGIELIHPEGNWKLKKEVGFSPVEMIAAAVGGCSSYVYQALLDKYEIPYVFHKLILSYERDEEKRTNPISSITMEFILTVGPEYQEQAKEMLTKVDVRCPVIQSLSSEINVHESVRFE